MDKLLYISTGIPKEQVAQLREKQFDFSSNALLPISVFHGNLLAGLAENYDEVTALCGVPISRRNFNIWHYSTRKIQNEKVQYVIPGFFNISIVKQIMTIIKIWWHIVLWSWKNGKHNRYIIIDGTFYTGLIALRLASFFRGVKIGAIMVDYYSYMNSIRETITQKIYYQLLRPVDFFMFVTEELQKVVNIHKKPYMIIEGVVDVQQKASELVESGGYCIYAGGLHEIYGVDRLVDAFHASQIPYSLHLYGSGELIDYIRKIEKEDPRIVYKGILAHDELLEVERRAKLLINPRPVRGKLDTRFNFPSKLMEYMQSGRPVITTKLLGIPEEYEQKMYFFEDDTTEAIKQGIEKILELDEQVLKAFGEQARDYVNENKNNVEVGRKIFCLMNAGEDRV